jgi:hypothetical protein
MKGGNETAYLSRSSDRSRERMAQHGDLNHDLTLIVLCFLRSLGPVHHRADSDRNIGR